MQLSAHRGLCMPKLNMYIHIFLLCMRRINLFCTIFACIKALFVHFIEWKHLFSFAPEVWDSAKRCSEVAKWRTWNISCYQVRGAVLMVLQQLEERCLKCNPVVFAIQTEWGRKPSVAQPFNSEQFELNRLIINYSVSIFFLVLIQLWNLMNCIQWETENDAAKSCGNECAKTNHWKESILSNFIFCFRFLRFHSECVGRFYFFLLIFYICIIGDWVDLRIAKNSFFFLSIFWLQGQQQLFAVYSSWPELFSTCTASFVAAAAAEQRSKRHFYCYLEHIWLVQRLVDAL